MGLFRFRFDLLSYRLTLVGNHQVAAKPFAADVEEGHLVGIGIGLGFLTFDRHDIIKRNRSGKADVFPIADQITDVHVVKTIGIMRREVAVHEAGNRFVIIRPAV